MQPPTVATLWRAAVTLGLGLLAGTLGTVMHRAVRPWGLVVCLLLVLVIVLVSRAWVGWFGYVASAGGAILAVQVLATGGPGGDVLVTGRDLWGPAWVIGVVLVVALVAFAPRRWVEDERPPTP
ncbi:hypothetical protein [Cellulomonas dongxiuzhuiae]|uniref:Histidinol dehydrogenase n=1 Tax=Cellulomonas dongxiuzhuiae TaxID=2819979 RepID=A0ABX8GM49_9CELL|nr:hypothetical protein [Cellulomonas dongxiuzhuiae]MBO3096564.1 hypothetical protein [Cellulomonas dongxiuzhuiae]QWC16952.1 hypothetical protein KKR89_04825 [Cellulomonas dongxiuzhuiae]